MRRRELVLVAAILVPFFVLVALALAWSAPGPSAAPMPAAPPAPTLDAGAQLARLPLSVPRTTAPATPDAGEPTVPPPEAPPPPELEAPLRAVGPEVGRCFRDTHTRPHGPVQVTMRFTPLADGGFAGARVEKDTGQDPYLDACLVDVFEELGFTPTGRETFREATYTFRWGADGGR